MIDIEKYENLSDEEKKEELLDSLSEFVREMAHRIAMAKAVAYLEQDIKPEDFDKAFEKEFKREWKKVEGKSKHEIAMIVVGEMMMKDMDVDIRLVDDSEGEDDE